MSRGTGKKDVGLCKHLKEYGTPLPPFCTPFDQPNTLNGHSTRTSKAVQTTLSWVKVFIVERLIFNPFHTLKIIIKDIAFHVGL